MSTEYWELELYVNGLEITVEELTRELHYLQYFLPRS